MMHSNSIYFEFHEKSHFNVIFIEFGKRIGVMESRIEKVIDFFIEKKATLETLVNRSFLSDDATKRGYLLNYNTKRNYLIE